MPGGCETASVSDGAADGSMPVSHGPLTISPSATVPGAGALVHPRRIAACRSLSVHASSVCTTWRIQSANTAPDVPQRLGQLAEFQMRMRVDQARQNRRVAEINDFVRCELARIMLSDANNPRAVNSYNRIGQRRPIARKHPAGSQNGQPPRLCHSTLPSSDLGPPPSALVPPAASSAIASESCSSSVRGYDNRLNQPISTNTITAATSNIVQPALGCRFNQSSSCPPYTLCAQASVLCVAWNSSPGHRLPVCTATSPMSVPSSIAPIDCCRI